jgi:hypothetical protein
MVLRHRGTTNESVLQCNEMSAGKIPSIHSELMHST